VRALIFDPFAGISGDMTLAALTDLGLPDGWLTQFVAGLGLGPIGVRTERVDRSGIMCCRVSFELPHEHAHRHLRDVEAIIARCTAPEIARTRAVDAFRRIAQAEAEVHGTTPDRVHFHEVGALDAILDIVCTMAAVEALGFETFHTRPVAAGSGWIDIAHGRFPVPAPATLKLLQGLEVTGTFLPGECTTPTGAAILATLAGGRRPPATWVPVRTGYGAGARNPEGHPNCLRLIAAESSAAEAEPLYLVQTDIDDLPAEYVPAAQDAIVAAGALDVVTLPVAMKKGRPGLRLEALAPASALQAILDALFRTTTTIGARYWPVARPALPRQEGAILFRGHHIRTKCVTLPGGATRQKPEYEDVAAAATELGLSVWEIREQLDSERER
jgi:pyridinium-3,5-bisthiocarboxylic acid mononucleotide nickel chelatase